MKTPHHFPARTKGSALVTATGIVLIMAMLSASIIGYSLNEMRLNERGRLSLRSENVAENITLYVAEQLTTKLQGMGTLQVGYFPWTGPVTNKRVIYMPPASAAGYDNVLVSEFNDTTAAANMEVRAAIEAKTGFAKVSDTTSSNNGLQVATANVPIIAKGYATHPTIGTVTTYVEQDMQLTLIPLFQFGMFYNMDLELYPSGDLTLSGPIHTNNSLLAHSDSGSSAVITFLDRVTAAEYIMADQALKCDTRNGAAGKTTPMTTAQASSGSVKFTNVAAPATPIDMKSNGTTTYNFLGSTLWADCRWGDTTKNISTALPTTTQLINFRDWATTCYTSNVRAGIHGVTKLVLPGIGGYKETNDPSTPEDDRNNGRQVIESPNHKRYNGSTFAATSDNADMKALKISWRAGLYIVVNPSNTSRSGTLPNGSPITLLPQTYRAWLNTPSGNAQSCSEVILPGQPSFGADIGPDATAGTADDGMFINYMPNRYTLGTAPEAGSNQVIRTIQRVNGTGTSYTAVGAIGATTITVAAGSGSILAGDIVTIGAYNYLVTKDLSGVTFEIASPGLIVAAAGALTVVTPANNLGTATSYTLSATAVNVITLTAATGTGVFYPGTTITIGAYKYLVTVAPTAAGPYTSPNNKIYIAAPGILGAAPGAGSTVIVDTTFTKTLGSAVDYQLNGVHALNATTLNIDSGVGTLLPGNIVKINANRYTVTSILTANATLAAAATTVLPANAITVTPGLAATDLADNTHVFVDPFMYTGYPTAGNAGTGVTYPADVSATPYAGEAYFFDMRRANNNGAIGNAGARSDFNRTTGVLYTPRPIVKIDFDMARFKMMFNRVSSVATTSGGYRLTLPGGTGTGWTNCIYNGDTTTPPTTALIPTGVYDPVSATYTAVASFPTAGNVLQQNPFALYYAPVDAVERAAMLTNPTPFLVSNSALAAAFYDGIAVYIHSLDAEVRVQTVAGTADRIDSGVRIINARGAAPSYTSATESGCTIATNDAAYIIGHYNANGTINGTSSSTGFGGYSATWPDTSSEFLCSVYGDATAILSQPTFTAYGSSPNITYAQTAGWCDAFSALPHSTNTDDTWDSAAGGTVDGVSNTTAIKPGVYPTTNKPGANGTVTSTTKFAAIPTEVSTALVIGIVPSNHNPNGLSDRPPSTVANNVNSGGANNFPRFLESWGDSNPLYIRGSMVALFESRVAMEPFTHSRCYLRPLRRWGLHNDLAQANHHVPLEPIVYSADRLGFRRLTASQYATRKAQIEAMAVLP